MTYKRPTVAERNRLLSEIKYLELQLASAEAAKKHIAWQRDQAVQRLQQDKFSRKSPITDPKIWADPAGFARKAAKAEIDKILKGKSK